MNVKTIRRFPFMSTVGAMVAVEFEDDDASVLFVGTTATVMGQGWTYTPMLNQQSDGTYKSDFNVPENMDLLSDAEIEVVAKRAVDDYRAFFASLQQKKSYQHMDEVIEKLGLDTEKEKP